MCSFRQVDERHVSCEVALMEWSPKMDLIALASMQGEVSLHRLSWQKVWVLPSPGGKEKEVKVSLLAWRPDGKVLAVGYDTGKIVLCDVENADILHTLDVKLNITSMTWVAKTDNATLQPPEGLRVFYKDCSSHFLPKLPSLSKSYGSLSKQVEESVEDVKKLKDQVQLNILAVGSDNGKIQLFSFGIFLSGELCIETRSEISKKSKIVSVILSEDFSLLTVIFEAKDKQDKSKYFIQSYEVPLLQSKHQEMQVIALKYGQVASLLGYLSSTIRSISEAWEDILLEIDSKLMNYAEEKSRLSAGSISDDFLELLMFGTPSDILEKFLLHDLTEKGLKKLGHSIELSYSNIQKLVLKHLQSVAQALFYHLSDMKGMALWYDRFGVLGLSVDAVSQAVASVGSFLMKATEIQQVIDNSMKNFKAFFRWLYAVILRLSDEPVPSEITKVTQQDLNFVAEFLKENFASEWDQEKKSTFRLERVGQYLKMENLSFPPPVIHNPWVVFLDAHPHIKDTGMLFTHYPEKSLVQQHAEVQDAIRNAFKGPSSVLGAAIKKRSEYILFETDISFFPRISHMTCLKANCMYTVFTTQKTPSPCVYVMCESLSNKSNIQALCVKFGEMSSNSLELKDSSSSPDRCYSHKVMDVQFYNEETISVLLVEDNEEHPEYGLPVLVQMTLKALQQEMKVLEPIDEEQPLCNFLITVDGSSLVDRFSYRRLENMKAISLAVSGSRKVACVLFASRRRVRLFEMDVEDEEEDQDETDQEDLTKGFGERDSSLSEFGLVGSSIIRREKDSSF